MLSRKLLALVTSLFLAGCRALHALERWPHSREPQHDEESEATEALFAAVHRGKTTFEAAGANDDSATLYGDSLLFAHAMCRYGAIMCMTGVTDTDTFDTESLVSLNRSNAAFHDAVEMARKALLGYWSEPIERGVEAALPPTPQNKKPFDCLLGHGITGLALGEQGERPGAEPW